MHKEVKPSILLQGIVELLLLNEFPELKILWVSKKQIEVNLLNELRGSESFLRYL